MNITKVVEVHHQHASIAESYQQVIRGGDRATDNFVALSELHR